MKTTIGNFLISRLRQMGVRHIFGVPGDFNLQLLEQIGETDGIEFVGNCNELNASYAADGYARMNGASALLTTYGVGDLSALCGVAGAAAEHSRWYAFRAFRRFMSCATGSGSITPWPRAISSM